MSIFHVDRAGQCRPGLRYEDLGGEAMFAKARAYEQEALAKAESQYAAGNKVCVPPVSLARVFEALAETQELVDRAVRFSGGTADVLVGHEPESPACGSTDSSRAPSGAVEALHAQVLRVLDSVHRLHSNLSRIERGVGL